MTERTLVDELVTQEDRDAAADWLEGGPGRTPASRQVRDGGADKTSLVQAFARHRIAALAKVRSLPVAEEVAWLIELPQRDKTPAMWWCGNSGGHPLWQQTVDHAVRFCRKEDALRVRDTVLCDDGCTRGIIVTDHDWMRP